MVDSLSRKGTIWGTLLGALLVLSGLLATLVIHRGPAEETILAGEKLFLHEFSPHDPLCGEGDGLGPVFNEKSCVACHFLSGPGGAGPNEKNVTAFEAFPVPGRAEIISGGVHAFATQRSYREQTAQLSALFPPVPMSFTEEYNEMCEGTRTRTVTRNLDPVQLEELNTPPLFGLAQIEGISETALSVNAAKRAIGKIGREFAGDFDGNRIGRLRHVDGSVGKFGWKGQFSTVEDFVANACAMELGLTNKKVAQALPQAYRPDVNAQLDMTSKQLYQLVSFVRSLPAPRQVLPTQAAALERVKRGEALFSEIGCADCHVPDIGGVTGVYSDFQLYDLDKESEGLYGDSDQLSEFAIPSWYPRPSEWKTPPLWGVADSAPYFHDGKSPTLKAAILRHSRDARFASDGFRELSSADQATLIEFLKTLRAPELASTKSGP